MTCGRAPRTFDEVGGWERSYLKFAAAGMTMAALGAWGE